uniref:(northern house mosquito) hypothetical protein n=1 Tax=Culex pipiens TaxID=7175 RepID=A0A8D8FEQ2_CULPI
MMGFSTRAGSSSGGSAGGAGWRRGRPRFGAVSATTIVGVVVTVASGAVVPSDGDLPILAKYPSRLSFFFSGELSLVTNSSSSSSDFLTGDCSGVASADESRLRPRFAVTFSGASFGGCRALLRGDSRRTGSGGMASASSSSSTSMFLISFFRRFARRFI